MLTLDDVKAAAAAEKQQFLTIIAAKDAEIADLKTQIPTQDQLQGVINDIGDIGDIVPDPAPPTQEQPVG